MSRRRLLHGPLDAQRAIAAVSQPDRGAVALFVGVVRDHDGGRVVAALEYTAYEPMAERELAEILDAARARFDVAVEAEHRLGRLLVGDAAVVVAAAHSHRAPAFDACRWVIDELKGRVPIWKRQEFLDGEPEWVHPGSERQDERAGPETARSMPASVRTRAEAGTVPKRDRQISSS